MATPDDLTGHVVAGKYELVRLIRRGMGTVYEARSVATAERCAVKLLNPELAGDAEVVRRFFREARAMTTVQSEHVVAAFDSGMDDARPFYAMEYLVGEDLGATLDRLGSLNQAAATKILYQATAGLARAHARGIVHRDVKPSNLFLVMADSGEVKVKVLDFGIAKVKMEVFSETLSSVTRTGSLLGTPFYMSPEQVKRASSIDSSADVWSLGVVLWECVTGKLPWGPVEGFGELIAAVLTADIGSVQEHAPWVRPELADILRRMLSRDLATRLSSAVQLLDALHPLVADGASLTRDELTSPAEVERQSIAPRLSFADTVAVSSSEDPVARDTTAGRSAPAAWRLPLGVAAVGALVAGLFALAPKGSTDPQPAAPIVPTHAPQPITATLAPAPAATRLRFPLAVGPLGVAVTVDGVPANVVDGKVELEGTPNESVRVTLGLGDRTLQRSVVLGASGPEPARIDLPEGRPTPREKPRVQRPERQEPLAKSPPVPQVPANDQPTGPVLSKDFE